MALFYGDLSDVDIHLTVRTFSNVLDLEGTIVRSSDCVSFLRHISASGKLHDNPDARSAVTRLGFRAQDGAILPSCGNRELSFQVDWIRADPFIGQLGSLAYIEQPASWHQTRLEKLPASNFVACSRIG